MQDFKQLHLCLCGTSGCLQYKQQLLTTHVAIGTPLIQAQHAITQYEGGEPCKVCGHVLTITTTGRPETVMPTTVVPGFLYLGSYDTASRQELLKAMQITDILNVSPTFVTVHLSVLLHGVLQQHASIPVPH